MMIDGITMMVYHPGTGTSMALEECFILPVPSDMDGDYIDSYLDQQIDRIRQDMKQGVHKTEDFGYNEEQG